MQGGCQASWRSGLGSGRQQTYPTSACHLSGAACQPTSSLPHHPSPSCAGGRWCASGSAAAQLRSRRGRSSRPCRAASSRWAGVMGGGGGGGVAATSRHAGVVGGCEAGCDIKAPGCVVGQRGLPHRHAQHRGGFAGAMRAAAPPIRLPTTCRCAGVCGRRRERAGG